MRGKHGAGLLGRQCDIGNDGDEVERLRNVCLGDQYALSAFRRCRNHETAVQCGGDVIRMAFDFGSESKGVGGREFGAAELSTQENSGDDRRGAGTKTDAERNVVLHVELYGRK